MTPEREAEIREMVRTMRARLSYAHQTWTPADACTRLNVDAAEELLAALDAERAAHEETRRIAAARLASLSRAIDEEIEQGERRAHAERERDEARAELVALREAAQEAIDGADRARVLREAANAAADVDVAAWLRALADEAERG